MGAHWARCFLDLVEVVVERDMACTELENEGSLMMGQVSNKFEEFLGRNRGSTARAHSVHGEVLKTMF